VGPGPAQVRALAGGVSNAVLAVETPGGAFVLKQSRPRLRTRDAWFSDIDRVWREVEVMKALAPRLPPGVVPAVLFEDRDNHVFAMAHAPAGARVWKEMLLAGEADPARAREAGRILGTIHDATARAPELTEPFADRTVFVQLRVDPYYRRVQERLPDVAALVAPWIDDLLTRSDGLCHGDFSPKNLLAHAGGFTLVDYETAHRGDPAMDLGFFHSHLVLKAVRHAGRHEVYFDLTRAFWQGYHQAAPSSPPDLEARGIGHLAVCLLARIDGTSPVDYLPEEDRRQAVRRLGRRLLGERPRRWGAVLEIAGSLLAGLCQEQDGPATSVPSSFTGGRPS
jgi:5-methylthioribose kinase